MKKYLLLTISLVALAACNNNQSQTSSESNQEETSEEISQNHDEGQEEAHDHEENHEGHDHHDHEGEENHDHEDHDHHDHEGEDDHAHHDHEGHDHHDHEVNFDPESVVKKEGDQYLMAHGDHYHAISASDLSEEEKNAADQYLKDHPNAQEEHEKKLEIQAGYFEDSDVKDRELSDWAGDWQSVLPYLEDGSLDPVMEKKAESGEMTAEEYKDYYQTGYASEVDRIQIDGDSVTFFEGENENQGQYRYDGYEILEYEKGNRGVRYLFSKTGGDDEAPDHIQFSDHHIAPQKVSHYHIYFGDESHEDLLKELDNWPTFYPADWTSEQIVEDQLHH